MPAGAPEAGAAVAVVAEDVLRREGDVALLAAAAARLGLPGGAVPEEPAGDTDRP